MNKRVIKFSFLLLILISLTQLTSAHDGCPAGEYPVIRLSGIINAHAVSGDTNPFGYSTPICLPNSNNPNPPNRICAGNNKMGNVHFSGIDYALSDISTRSTWEENFAFPTFLEWLGAFLQGMNRSF